MENTKLKDKVVLVTGGGSGIGRAAAILFAQHQARVIIANRRDDKGLETKQIIEDNGGQAHFFQTDVAKREEVKHLISAIANDFGRLDCAFNNAGVDGKPGPVADFKEEDWDYIIDINLKGTFLLMKYEIQQMLKQGQGAIVNMSSVAGRIARANRCAYTASRHGIEGLTKVAALEYARRGIRINAVGPASIRTDIYYRSTQGDPEKERLYAEAHPIGRIGEAEEVAQAALWLCSDDASLAYGHTLVLDGGFSIQ
jgi:NAD(P)-dependent dehydrogenase (short-subunit alcohol dehydrogenase family)